MAKIIMSAEDVLAKEILRIKDALESRTNVKVG